MDFPQISPDESHLKLFILYNNRFFLFLCRPCTVNERFLLFRIDKLLGFGGYLVPDGATTRAQRQVLPHPLTHPREGLGYGSGRKLQHVPERRGRKRGIRSNAVTLSKRGGVLVTTEGFFFNPSTIKSNQKKFCFHSN